MLILLTSNHEHNVQTDTNTDHWNGVNKTHYNEELSTQHWNQFWLTSATFQKFTTKNPTIIWTVAQMVNRLCVDKLAEIEAGITIPA